jgi:hypothetical protein
MEWMVLGINFFRLLDPPLKLGVVGPFPSMGCMVLQMFAAGGD